MHALLKNVDTFCKNHDLIGQGQTIIIGLSGGPDSVALLDMLAQLRTHYNLTLIAAHLDHGWRPESTQEAQFCADLAKKIECEFVCAHAADFAHAITTKGSLEEQGRAVRRAFFQKIKARYSADAIALAHHSDDQRETFFIRLFRGAGVTGLAGMRPRDNDSIRPLLGTSKKEILAYLADRKQAYCTDPTNESEEFLRNRIRKTVIPALRSCDKRFDASLDRTMHHLAQARDFIDAYVHKTFETISKRSHGTLWIDSAALAKYEPFVQNQIVLHWLITSSVPFTPSQALLNEILRFLRNKKSLKHTFYGSWQILKQKNYATIRSF